MGLDLVSNILKVNIDNTLRQIILFSVISMEPNARLYSHFNYKSSESALQKGQCMALAIYEALKKYGADKTVIGVVNMRYEIY